MKRVALFASLLFAVGTASAATETDNLDISIEVINACRLVVYDGANGHQYGALGDVRIVGGLGVRGGDIWIPSWGQIVVECNKGVSYTLDIDQGMHYGQGPAGTKRALANGMGNFISYDIWTDHDSGVEWMTGKGSNGGTTNDTIDLHEGMTSYGHEWSTPGDMWMVNMVPGAVYWDQNLVTLTYN